MTVGQACARMAGGTALAALLTFTPPAAASHAAAQEPHGATRASAAQRQPSVLRRASAAPAARRFNSMFPSIHAAVTAAGFEGIPISRSMLRLVQRANRQIDIASVKLLPGVLSFGGRLVPSASYRHDEHFDRPVHLSDAEAYEAAMRVVRRETAAVVELIGAREHEAAARVLGRLLHAWQDLAAHSNIAFLMPAGGVAVPAPTDPAPPGLRITSYDRNAADPESPDDPLQYTHADFSLDHARKNAFARDTPASATRARYELAVQAAVGFTRASIESVARSVGERYSDDAWRRFLRHDARRTTGAWSTAAVVEIDGAHAGARVARRITELVPALHAGLGAYTDGDLEAGLELHVEPFGPRIGTFALLGHSLTGEGVSYGGGVNVRVLDRMWLPDVRVAGDSERGLLVGLATRF
jgi:hypothetical protein